MATRGAHVRKRGTNTWQIIIEQPPDPEDGSRQRLYRTVQGTKKEAEKTMREMLAELDAEIFIKDTGVTVQKFFAEWLNTYIMPHKSPTTSATYVYNIENYIYPAFGTLKLSELNTLALQKWFNDLSVKSPLSDRPLTPKTIRNIWMNLNAGLKRAVQLEVLKKNPAQAVELPRCKQYRAEVYSAEELQKLIEIIRGTDIEIGVMILICLGLRRGELMGLTWENVNFDTNMISIEKTVTKANNKPITKGPKTESGRRTIEAPDILVKLLNREKVSYLQRKLQYGAAFKDNNLIICQEDGAPYTPDYYSHKFKRLLLTNGLKVIRLHDLRHSNATFMLKLGVSAKVMQKRLGHSTFGITMDTYSHVLDDMQKEAAEKLNDGLESIISKAQ